MIKALISIEVDLAASRAIRFACQLGNFMPMEIHPVYTKEAPPRDLSIGSGWARHHWEQELIQQGKTEIADLISSEIDYCPVLKTPRVVFGDRDAALARLLEKETFDLYVEGAHFPWSQAMLHQRMHSKLFQRVQVPIVLARVLRKIYKLLVLCLDAAGTRALGAVLPRLWSGCAIPVSLALPAAPEGNLLPEVNLIKQSLDQTGHQVDLQEAFPFLPAPPTDEYLRQYGIVAFALERGIKKDSPQLVWLSEVKVPLLLVLY